MPDDFDSVSRPQGAGDDIGAYEYTNLVATQVGTSTSTALPSRTSTIMPSPTPTSTFTRLSTFTANATPTLISTFTPSKISTLASTPTSIRTTTFTIIPSRTSTSTPKPAATVTPTYVSTFTHSPTRTSTSKPISTATAAPTNTSTIVASPTRTLTSTPKPAATAAPTNTSSLTLGAPSGAKSSWDHYFRWTGMTGVTSYWLEVKDGSGTKIVSINYDTSICSGLTCAVKPDATASLTTGSYTWRVDPYIPASGWGAWSSISSFSRTHLHLPRRRHKSSLRPFQLPRLAH